MSDNDGDNAPEPYSRYLRSVLEQGIVMGNLPKVTTDPNRLEEQARKAMDKVGFEYIRGSAGESATMVSNRLAFRAWKLVPRMLRPTGQRDMSVTLFGKKYGMNHTDIHEQHFKIITDSDFLFYFIKTRFSGFDGTSRRSGTHASR